MRRVRPRRLLVVLAAAVAAIVLVRLSLAGPGAPTPTAPPTVAASGRPVAPVSPGAGSTPGPPVLVPLPVTTTDLDQAARTAAAFVTYRYDEPPTPTSPH